MLQKGFISTSRSNARLFLVLSIAGALLAPCPLAGADAPAGRAAIEPGPSAQARLQTALIEASPGEAIELAAGTFDFTATLSLDVPNVTLRGQGRDETILSFAGLLPGQADPTKLGILKPPVAAGMGSGGMQYDIVPGKPEKSIMMFRLLSTHPDVMMPELGKRLVHEEGVELIRRWIAAMK